MPAYWPYDAFPETFCMVLQQLVRKIHYTETVMHCRLEKLRTDDNDVCRGGYGMLLHLLRRQHTPAQCKHFQAAVSRINNLPHKPLILLPYLFGKQLYPTGNTCAHCHANLLYTLLRTKVTPTKMGVVTEIHTSTNSCVVVWKVPRFRQLTQPTYSFDFRTPQNRVLHMRIDPLVCPCCICEVDLICLVFASLTIGCCLGSPRVYLQD
jgi:hypothetical protein